MYVSFVRSRTTRAYLVRLTVSRTTVKAETGDGTTTAGAVRCERREKTGTEGNETKTGQCTGFTTDARPFPRDRVITTAAEQRTCRLRARKRAAVCVCVCDARTCPGRRACGDCFVVFRKTRSRTCARSVKRIRRRTPETIAVCHWPTQSFSVSETVRRDEAIPRRFRDARDPLR